MRHVLSTGLFFGAVLLACGEEASAPEPIVETADEVVANEPSSDPVEDEAATVEPAAENETPEETEEAEASADAPTGPLNVDATVSGDGERGLTFGGVLRLAGAIGLPRPTLHGRPTEVGEGKYVVLISFQELEAEPDTEIADLGVLRPEIWLIATNDDGTIQRQGFLPIGHVPLTQYSWLSVGEVTEQATELFDVKAVRAEDLDDDGETEFAFVVEVDDEVVCGPGLLTHRYFLIYNTEPALALAADIGLAEASGSGEYTRATTRLVDHNEDGHRDIHLRTKSCSEGDYADDSCTAEESIHTYYLWNEDTDVWRLDQSSRAPCGEG